MDILTNNKNFISDPSLISAESSKEKSISELSIEIKNSQEGQDLISKSKDNLNTLYNLPEYYDIAFSRDLSKDIEFLIKCFWKYAAIEIKILLEPACGSGIFLAAFPKYGFNIIGYDLSPEMVIYANERIEESGFSDNAKAILGDMRNIKFDQKFDAAVVTINSIGYLTSEEDILNHFRNTAQCLNRGGLYILEIASACEDIKNEIKPDEVWFAERNGIKVESKWYPYKYDFQNKTRHILFSMKVQHNDQFFEYEEEHTLRLWLFNDIKRIVQEAGFEIKAIHNQDYDLIPLNSNITGELGALYYILMKV